MPRYLRPADGLFARLAATRPALHFNGSTAADWAKWRRDFHRALLGNLGPAPASVPLNPEILSRTDCGSYTREYVIFDSEAFASVPAWLLVPKSATAGQPAPGVLCCHGHDVLGKHAVVGVDSDGNPVDTGAYHQMAVRLAERGYVAIAPDWRGFGERRDTDEWVRRPSRDGCNVYYLGAGYFGYHALALQIHDGQRTLDYLLSRPEVRPDRIGCVGVSFGGTMTTYLAALDERIGCAVIVCYLNTMQDLLERANTCGSQYMPGLATLGDVSDVAGLIAPRPMMAEIGEHDACFTVDDAMRCYAHVASIYAAAGVPERCAVDRFDGGHEFHGTLSLEWFDRWLGGGV